jgi:hypothetical protein
VNAVGRRQYRRATVRDIASIIALAIGGVLAIGFPRCIATMPV